MSLLAVSRSFVAVLLTFERVLLRGADMLWTSRGCADLWNWRAGMLVPCLFRCWVCYCANFFVLVCFSHRKCE
jgi:hypothetical protein